MSVKKELFKIFEELGFPFWLMHQMPDDVAYPNSFFTYLTTDAPYTEYFDNIPLFVSWTFMVGIYTDNPAIMDETIKELVKKLRAAGWTIEGPGEDVQSDEQTHIGRRLTIKKTEAADIGEESEGTTE